MKIALIGATGFVGTALLNELLERGHNVTAIVRRPEKISSENSNLTVLKGDVFDTQNLAFLLNKSDAVISAYNPGWTNPNIYDEFLEGTSSIQEAVKLAGVKRFFVIGGAGSLYIAPGKQIVDTEGFPEEIKPGALAARDYLNMIQKETELDWTFLSPATEMHQGTSGTRKGTYRIGIDSPVFDEDNRNIISVEDIAVAVVDEIEKPAHIRRRFTVAY